MFLPFVDPNGKRILETMGLLGNAIPLGFIENWSFSSFENETNFLVNVTKNTEEIVSKVVYEREVKKAFEKLKAKDKKTKDRAELQKSMQEYVKKKPSSSSNIKVKNPSVSPKPSPAPIKVGICAKDRISL